MQSNGQQFSEMRKAALEGLRGKDPAEIARLGGISFDGGAFHLESLGEAVAVSYPDYALSSPLEPWHILLTLHYLACADGTPLSGRQITFSQYPDGMVRGGDFDRDVEELICRGLGQLPPEELERRCRAAGAVREVDRADLSMRFSFFPRYPLWLKIWFADEEFPASGRLLLDASAGYYLSIEDAVTAGSLLLERLLPGKRLL